MTAMSIGTRIASVAALLATTAGSTMAQTIQGSATYRERMALPPAAVFEAVLEDVSRADAPAEAIARARLPSPGNPPIAFTIAYDPSRIMSNHMYVVRAQILVDDKLLFTTDTAAPVITGGHPTNVSLMLRRAGGQTPPRGAGGTGSVEGTYWRATELAGKRVPTQDPKREAHLHFQAGRVSGSDGCNRLTGNYQLNGDRVTFGQMVGTQMACLNPSGTEDLFRDALKNASRLTVAGDRLELFDSAGTRLAVFTAGSQGSAGPPSAR